MTGAPDMDVRVTPPLPDEEPPRGAFHYAMHRVIGPAVAVVILVVMLVVFPLLLATDETPFTRAHLFMLFAVSCAGFWAWARFVDARSTGGRR